MMAKSREPWSFEWLYNGVTIALGTCVNHHSPRWRLQFPMKAYFIAVFVVAIDALLLKHASDGIGLLLRMAIGITVMIVFRLVAQYATQGTWRVASAAVAVMLVYLVFQGPMLPHGVRVETWTDAVLASWYPYVRQSNPLYDPNSPSSQEFLPDLARFLDCGSLLIGINLGLLSAFIGCHLRWDHPPGDEESAARWSASGTKERLTTWHSGDDDG
jgi:hypothetical protein